jgi:hypothetical protein
MARKTLLQSSQFTHLGPHSGEMRLGDGACLDAVSLAARGQIDQFAGFIDGEAKVTAVSDEYQHILHRARVDTMTTLAAQGWGYQAHLLVISKGGYGEPDPFGQRANSE